MTKTTHTPGGGPSKIPATASLDPVLVVAPEPFFEDRGTPIALRHVIMALSAKGFQVDLLTFPMGRQIKIPGVRILRIPNPFNFIHVPIGLSLRKVILDVILCLKLWGVLKQKRYCCIHAVEESAFAAVLMGKRCGLPVIYDMQSSLPEQLKGYLFFRHKVVQLILLLLERLLIKNSDMVICSAGLEDYLRQIHPACNVAEWYFPASLYDSIPEAETNRLRAELDIPSSKKIVLYCGNFERYQGVDTLIEAMPRVVEQAPDTILLLVGAELNNGHSNSKMLKQLMADGALRILPRQPNCEIPKFLAMSDIAVSSRLFGANLPLKIFEYMAAGKPIIATDIPAHRRVLNEKRALFVNNRGLNMSEAIVRLVKDQKLSNRLGAAAREFAKENLSSSSFAIRLAQSYKDTLQGRNLPGC